MAFSSFERRRRLVARVALYTSLLTVGSLTWLAHSLMSRTLDLGAETAYIDVRWVDEPAVRVLQQYLRIDSTSLVGDEYGAALFLGSLLRAGGLDVTIERLGDRRANLWGVVEGDERQALVLAGHLDTEPVLRPDDWAHPPFGGRLRPPWIFGRGAFDMKSYTVAQLFATLETASSPHRPSKSLILLATSGEERGSDLGTVHLLREHPRLIGRFWAVVTEGGVVEVVNLDEPVKYWGTEFAQKRFVELRACHGTRDRLEQLLDDITRHGRPSDRLEITPELRTFLAAYASTRGAGFIRRALQHPDRTALDITLFQGLPAYLQSLFRDEVVAFSVEESPEGGYELPILVHLLPGSELEPVVADLLPPWMTHGITIREIERETAPFGSPIEHPVFRAIDGEIAQAYPGQPHGPFVLFWSATDARFFRQAGIVSYGFSPFLILAPDTMGMGTVNEKIGLPGFHSGVDLYRHVVRRIVEARP